MSRLEHHQEVTQLIRYELTEDDLFCLADAKENFKTFLEKISSHEEEVKRLLDAENIKYDLIQVLAKSTTSIKYEILIPPAEEKKLKSVFWYYLSRSDVEALNQSIPLQRRKAMVLIAPNNSGWNPSVQQVVSISEVLKELKLLPYVEKLFNRNDGRGYNIKLKKNISHFIFNLIIQDCIQNNLKNPDPTLWVHLTEKDIKPLSKLATLATSSPSQHISKKLDRFSEFENILIKLHLKDYIDTYRKANDGFYLTFKTRMTPYAFKVFLNDLLIKGVDYAQVWLQKGKEAEEFIHAYRDHQNSQQKSLLISSLFKSQAASTELTQSLPSESSHTFSPSCK